jgi:hypothetical protein
MGGASAWVADCSGGSPRLLVSALLGEALRMFVVRWLFGLF